MNQIDPTRLAERMKSERIGQAELARRVGVSQPTIAKLLKGDSRSSAFLHLIAAELETTPAFLTKQTDDPDLGAVKKPGSAELKEQLDAMSIAELDLKFGMGGGAYLDVPVEINHMLFSRKWISNFTNAPAEKLFFAFGMGDSMAPTIHDGDLVLIDCSQNIPRMQDQIWALTLHGMGLIKRLRATGEGYKILSDNPNVSDDIATDGEMHVIGRVIAIVRKV